MFDPETVLWIFVGFLVLVHGLAFVGKLIVWWIFGRMEKAAREGRLKITYTGEEK